ncbi:MAG: threonine--tRNA ligase [Bdellovibrio sp.]|nr:threonine--tRNA ligase [Bdellovibrio sp.]
MQDDQKIDHNSKLYQIRHSLAHILAQAVLEVRPGSKLGFGPPIDDGFYYDFILSSPLTEEDFKEIEKKMKYIIKLRQPFVREDLPKTEALKRIEEMGEPYKREYAEELISKHGLNSLSFYKNGTFLDMCEGPHLKHTGEIDPGCFKIRSLAGAYWRGDSRNAMMTRIYAWAFETKEELDRYVKAWEEAQARDHKKLGKELEFFAIDEEIGKGLPLWLPHGTVIRDEIEKLMREFEFQDGYQRVTTPCITKTGLYHKTGHLPYYKDAMFPFMEVHESVDVPGSAAQEKVKETYVLRPMNCPHHHRIFASKLRSYRELPLRLAEYGNVFRFEDSGSVSGLLRVRGMCMNDAHIYCTEDQIEEEFLKVMRMHAHLYDLLGLKNYYMRHSTWDPEDPKGKEKFVNDPAAWEFTQDRVRRAMDKSGLPYKEVKGEAAFYGPKVDFQMSTVTGREETISTNQLDFAVPARLGLEYIGADNKAHRPYVIHRAPAGTHERFVAFLIEHFGAAFPTWLAPVQAKVIPISEHILPYANQLVEEMRKRFIRAEVDDSNDSINKKIRTNTKKKIPNLLIVGERESESQEITLRRYGIENQQTMKKDEFFHWIEEKIKTRALN